MSAIEEIRDKGTFAAGKLREGKAAAGEASDQFGFARALSEEGGLLQQSIDTSKKHGGELQDSLRVAVGHLAGFLMGLQQVRMQAEDTESFLTKGLGSINNASGRARQAREHLEGVLPIEEVVGYTDVAIIKAFNTNREGVTAERTAQYISRQAKSSYETMAPLAETLEDVLRMLGSMTTRVDEWNNMNGHMAEIDIIRAELEARETVDAANDGAVGLEQRVADL